MADEPQTPAAEKQPEGGKQEPTPQEPEKTFTQADVDRVVSDRLDRERKKYEGFDDLKAKAAQFDELSEKDKSEAQKLEGKLTKEAQRAEAAEAKLTRYEVANEKGVPAKLVPLLTATAREDLESQADLILENAKPADPNFDGGAREPAPDPKTPAQEHNDLAVALFGQPRQP